jgi:glucoamylase
VRRIPVVVLLFAALPALAATLPALPASADALFDGRRPAAAVDLSAQSSADVGLDAWLENERGVALQKMEADISPAGAAPGSVAASPSHANPNYWYNWRRDAALTMDEIVTLYGQASDPDQKAAYGKMLDDYASFVHTEQTDKTLTGLGEPKFNMDGTAFNDPWGRPQDDAPAEEASTLIDYAAALLKAGQTAKAKALYGDFATGIKGDLEYVSHHWPETSFDVWEEVKAHHFDTQMAQRTALLEGAWLADQLGDPAAAAWYRRQAAALDAMLAAHWDPKNGYIDSALDQDAGLGYKGSDLDSAVILGAIHRRALDGTVESPSQLAEFAPTDPRVLATAEALKAKFRAEYPINASNPGVAIGRYPEDQYMGGNPWVLLTAAYAQLEYMAAADFLSEGSIPVQAADLSFFQDLLSDPADKAALKAGLTLSSGDALFGKLIDALAADGDLELACVRAHANPDGSLSEQIDKNSGYMTSAADLTWNYASFLTALQARDALAAARANKS